MSNFTKDPGSFVDAQDRKEDACPAAADPRGGPSSCPPHHHTAPRHHTTNLLPTHVDTASVVPVLMTYSYRSF